MKNKRNTYILLSAVIVLWGSIAYRVFESMNPPKDNKNKIVIIEKFQPKKRITKETYTIHANYRDPFLGTIEKNKSKTKNIPKKKKEKIVYPIIEYKGVFSSSHKNNTVYLILINRKREMFKINEIHQEVKLLQGNKKKITVKYKTEKQTFYLKK